MKRQFLTLSTGLVLALVATMTIALSGCQSTSKNEVEESAAPPPSEFDDARATAKPKSPPPKPQTLNVAPVYFDFDKSDIRPDARPTLKTAHSVLTESGLNVVIEGHCDNRGTEEYNLALGERRAASVRRYLANLGVQMSQMTIVSYGELRPVAQGNTEAAWALNRRAEFTLAD
jgi:peptidoglycan-associated lipoprotein